MSPWKRLGGVNERCLNERNQILMILLKRRRGSASGGAQVCCGAADQPGVPRSDLPVVVSADDAVLRAHQVAAVLRHITRLQTCRDMVCLKYTPPAGTP